MSAVTTHPNQHSLPVLHDEPLRTYLAAVASEGERFASVAAAGAWDAPVAACPGWDLRELVRHVGLVHLWAAANVRFPSDQWLTVREMSDLAPYWPDHTTGWPSDEELVAWYRSTLANLLDVLGTTPPDHRCLTFLPAPSPLVMWARRQASEIAVHRYDAEAAMGRTAHFEADFAADMLDELLVGFSNLLRGSDDGDLVLQVDAEDLDEQFFVTMDAGGVCTSRTGNRADLRVSGTAADLYIFLWNRPAGPSIRIDGDESALTRWSRTSRIQWR